MNKQMLEKYLSENPERFNNAEKQKLRSDFQQSSSGVISDELYDFFVYCGGIYAGHYQPRHEIFGRRITRFYPNNKLRKVLDVGAGRMCKLSKLLADSNYDVTALDTNIRLRDNEISNFAVRRQLFTCDEFAPNNNGTDISEYDFVLGLEPCDATEHIIRQGTKYDKLFEVALCAAPHNALDGTKFNSYHDWYDYLDSISDNFKIRKTENFYIATNKSHMGL